MNQQAEPANISDLGELTGTASNPVLGRTHKILLGVCLIWSFYHLYIASPLPYMLAEKFGSGFIIGSTKARLIHYAFAAFLTFSLMSPRKPSQGRYVTGLNWLLAVVAASSALYIFFFYDSLAQRSGAPKPVDIFVSGVGVLILLEATRRMIGTPLALVAGVFITYGFAGPYLSDIIAHRGNSFGRMADHLWLSTEGVFGLALSVSSSLIFLFVLFGALLEKAGAGSYFIRVSFSLLGHLKGGPAKAAVISSALTGIISGSALANIVTTGTFTIPLMKKVGFSSEKAAAIESSSSINGQLMPPVMGAAAFIMTEFVGIGYAEVIKHAFLPAVLSYMGLLYIVHLEAEKMQLQALKRVKPLSHTIWLVYLLAVMTGAVLFGLSIYVTVLLVRQVFEDSGLIVMLLLSGLVYVGLLFVASRVNPEDAGEGSSFEVIPEIGPTIRSGLYHLLPVVVLIWLLVVERYSPSLSVFWAIISLLAVMITQRPLMAFLKNDKDYGAALKATASDIIGGMISGAQNMIGVAIALAAAGVVVGIVSLTGLALMMVNLIGAFSGDSLVVMLILTAIVSIILGMGLPTTANYVVVATLMAPVVVALGAQNGLVLPLIAVHLFVFYAGLMSGNTPPVAVDAYAAAALANAKPMETCIQAFYYSGRTMVLPFIFIFNTELLLIGVESIWHLLYVFGVAVVAMMAFVAATQAFLLVRAKAFEVVLLLLAAFTLLVPGFWIDKLQSPFEKIDPVEIYSFAESQPDGSVMRIWVHGENFSGDEISKVVVLPLGESGQLGPDRLDAQTGLSLIIDEGNVVVDSARFGGAASGEGLDYGWQIESIEVQTIRPAKEWVYIPGFLLILLVFLTQHLRRRSTVNA